MSRNTKTVLALLAAVLVLAVVPFFLAPGAEMGEMDINTDFYEKTLL